MNLEGDQSHKSEPAGPSVLTFFNDEQLVIPVRTEIERRALHRLQEQGRVCRAPIHLIFVASQLDITSPSLFVAKPERRPQIWPPSRAPNLASSVETKYRTDLSIVAEEPRWSV